MRKFPGRFKSTKTDLVCAGSGIDKYLSLNDFHTEKRDKIRQSDIVTFFIDPGTKNCGMRCTKKSSNGEKELVFFDLINFGQKNECLHGCLAKTVNSLTTFKSILVECDYIVIEKQLSQNVDLTRQMQNIETCIMLLTKDQGRRPIIVEIDARAKSIAFEKCTDEHLKPISRYMKNKQTKEKGKDAAMTLLEEDGDSLSIDAINKTKKKDDMSDVVCYEYVWWKYLEEMNIPIKLC